jgi:hypothetical protein
VSWVSKTVCKLPALQTIIGTIARMSKSPRTATPASIRPANEQRPAPRPWQKFVFAVAAMLLSSWVIFLAWMAKK